MQHKDVEVLSLEILEKSPGIIISEKLNNLAKQVGTPVQIVSDRGSDIKKGIDLYRQNNPRVIATYDVTHKMANLLKKELSQDERFQEFLRECSLTRQRVQQTKLYFLIPPKQRAKARYHNVDILIEWAIKIIKYEENQDFSSIDTTYSLDREALELLSTTVSAEILTILKSFATQIYDNRHEFAQSIMNKLGTEIWQIHGENICQYSDLGRRKFYAKLGWLSSYKQDIQIYADMLTLICSVQTQLKNQGLTHQSFPQWWQSIVSHSFTPRVEKIRKQIEEYLIDETSKIPAGQILLGTSDVIESLFGKYKIFAARRPLKDLGTSILLIPLSTIEVTIDLVKEAMESIRFIDVCSWAKSVFGSSMLSQRRSLKSAPTSDTKPA